MRRFLASNSMAILSLIAIKNSQRESREGQGARVFTNLHFVPGPMVGSRRPWLFATVEYVKQPWFRSLLKDKSMHDAKYKSRL